MLRIYFLRKRVHLTFSSKIFLKTIIRELDFKGNSMGIEFNNRRTAIVFSDLLFSYL